jgi:hypothetical protein
MSTSETNTPTDLTAFFVEFTYTGPNVCRLLIRGDSPEAVEEEIRKSLRKDITDLQFRRIELVEDPDSFDPESLPPLDLEPKTLN